MHVKAINENIKAIITRGSRIALKLLSGPSAHAIVHKQPPHPHVFTVSTGGGATGSSLYKVYNLTLHDTLDTTKGDFKRFLVVEPAISFLVIQIEIQKKVKNRKRSISELDKTLKLIRRRREDNLIRYLNTIA